MSTYPVVLVLERPDSTLYVIHLNPLAQRPDEDATTFEARGLEENLTVRPALRAATVHRIPRVVIQSMLAQRLAWAEQNQEVYRSAWRMVAGTLTHDMPIARNLKMTEIRAERDQQLAITDGQMARAQEVGTPAEVVTLRNKRQALRDLPVTVEAELAVIQSVDDLATYEPTWPT